MARHCTYGAPPVTASCVSTQRCAALSYCTIGSPSLAVWHRPPNPAHNVLPAAGPYTGVPVDLSNTANDVFSHSTICVAPTALFESGGAEVTTNVPCGPTKPTP